MQSKDVNFVPAFLRNKAASTKVQSLKAAQRLGLGDDIKATSEISTEPEDFCRNPLYYENSIVKIYLHASMYSYDVVHGNEYFNMFMTFVIVIAGVLVGIESYPGLISDKLSAQLDIVIVTIFLLELLFKICMEGVRPWRYFTGPLWKWNWFDFAIVATSLYFSAASTGSGSLAFLRLIRLARIGKLIECIPALQVIMQGLVGGMIAIYPVTVMLIIVFYLFGVIGFYLFSTNDPFHFGNLLLSMITLLRVSLFDNSGDVMYINIFGCMYYPDVYSSPPSIAQQFNNTNNTNYNINNSSAMPTPTITIPANSILWCMNPQPQPVQTTTFFVIFLLVAAFAVQSLFVGAISTTMSESLQRVEKESKDKARQRTFDHNLARLRMLSDSHDDCDTGRSVRSAHHGNEEINNDVTPSGINMHIYVPIAKRPWFLRLINLLKTLRYHAITGLNRFRRFSESVSVGDPQLEQAILRATIGTSLAVAMGWKDHDARRSLLADASNNKDHAEACLLYIDDTDALKERSWPFRSFLWITVKCYESIHSKYFSYFSSTIVIAALVNIGLETDLRFMADPTRAAAAAILEVVIITSLAAEVLITLLSYGMRPLAYFRHRWNLFDVFVLITSLIPSTEYTSTLLRIIRLQRVLKLVKLMPHLEVIIAALVESFASVGYLALVLTLFFYAYAVLGNTFFAANDPWHWGSLHLSILTLFRMVTFDSTFAVMYISQYGCDVYQDVYGTPASSGLCSTPHAHGWFAVVYFLFFIFIAGQVLLTLFIGVVSRSLATARSHRLSEDKHQQELKRRAAKLMLSAQRVNAFRRVFVAIDLDEGGCIEADELQMGLQAIGLILDDDQLQDGLARVDPDRRGIGLVGFIDFMSRLPLYKRSLGQWVEGWRESAFTNGVGEPQNGVNDKRNWTLSGSFWSLHNFVAGCAGSTAWNEALREEAALIIQQSWTDYKRRKSRQMAFCQ